MEEVTMVGMSRGYRFNLLQEEEVIGVITYQWPTSPEEENIKAFLSDIADAVGKFYEATNRRVGITIE